MIHRLPERDWQRAWQFLDPDSPVDLLGSGIHHPWLLTLTLISNVRVTCIYLPRDMSHWHCLHCWHCLHPHSFCGSTTDKSNCQRRMKAWIRDIIKISQDIIKGNTRNSLRRGPTWQRSIPRYGSYSTWLTPGFSPSPRKISIRRPWNPKNQYCSVPS